MLVKRRNAGKPRQSAARLDTLKLPVMKIKMSDYKTYHHDKERLKEAAELWLAEPLELDAATDLESLRKLLAKDRNMDSCCFIDRECHFSQIYLVLEIIDAFCRNIRYPIACFFQRVPRRDSSGSIAPRNNCIT